MGQLRGQWQIMEIARQGQEAQQPDQLYIKFDQGLMQLSDYGFSTFAGKWYVAEVSGSDPDYTFTFNYLLDRPEMLYKIQPWGFDAASVAVTILVLDSNRLQMQAGPNLITCRRF